jgi:small neutral amino acid transporter SnatA (MarC family)
VGWTRIAGAGGALREVVIAFGVLALFMVGGQAFLQLMRLSERSLEVAGGVILLIIAIRMIFASGGEVYAADAEGREPFIFPLAVPLLAGPVGDGHGAAAGLAPADSDAGPGWAR